MVSVNPDQLQSQAQSMSLIALWSTQEFDIRQWSPVPSYHCYHFSLFILCRKLISAPKYKLCL